MHLGKDADMLKFLIEQSTMAAVETGKYAE
jgi:hypothetical protein